MERSRAGQRATDLGRCTCEREQSYAIPVSENGTRPIPLSSRFSAMERATRTLESRLWGMQRNKGDGLPPPFEASRSAEATVTSIPPSTGNATPITQLAHRLLKNWHA